jgi:hypothetical protein
VQMIIVKRPWCRSYACCVGWRHLALALAFYLSGILISTKHPSGR